MELLVVAVATTETAVPRISPIFFIDKNQDQLQNQLQIQEINSQRLFHRKKNSKFWKIFLFGSLYFEERQNSAGYWVEYADESLSQNFLAEFVEWLPSLIVLCIMFFLVYIIMNSPFS